MDAAVVELDALADPVGSRAQDHHLGSVGGPDLVLLLPRRVVVRRLGRELGATGVDGLVGREHAGRLATLAHLRRVDAPQVGELGVGEPQPLRPAPPQPAESVRGRGLNGPALLGDGQHLVEKPGVDPGGLVDLVDGVAPAQQRLDLEDPFGRGDHGRRCQGVVVHLVECRLGQVGIESEPSVLERPQPLLEGLGEGSADGHDLADRLHRSPEHAGRSGELLERPTGDLGDDVVDGRLEGRRGLLSNVVWDLVEGVADREAGCDLGDREAGGLRGQCRRAAHPRVHLDDDLLPGVRIDGELHVGATRLHADPAQAGEGSVAHLLVLEVGQRLDGRHRDRVAGVDAHGVEVLDRADDDAVVGPVAHDLELELLPASDRAFDEDLVDPAGVEALGRDPFELLGCRSDAGAAPTEDVGRTDHGRKADALDHPTCLVHVVGDTGGWDVEADLEHRRLEALAVLGRGDGLGIGADQLDPVLVEDAGLNQLHRQVQRRLAAERRQQGIGALLVDDPGEDVEAERFDVGGVGEVRIRHDRRRVRVGEDDPIALLAQHAAGLGPGVVELAGLADHDRSGADEQDAPDVVPAGHQARTFPVKAAMRSSNSAKR